MKIVVLDGGTLNPGDLSWRQLEALGRCDVYDATDQEEIISRCLGAEIVIINKVFLDRRIISQLPDLKYIGVTATGYNVVDVAAARERGIVVTNVPTYGTQSVAQMVFAHLLELAQHVGHHWRTVRQGRWSACGNFCYWDYPLVELAGLTMGIVGYGRIGRATAKLAKAFGMGVLAYDIESGRLADEDVKSVDLETLFSESDVVSLHCPLTADTNCLVNAERLARMKQSAFIINTSRGPLVNEQDLADALNSGRIAGAGLDVLSTEPPKPDNPLLHARNCCISPHIAWATRSARKRLMSAVVENVQAFIAGHPTNTVSN